MTSSQPSLPSRLAVVTLDWLPAWMLTTWGTTWLATPAFDALAARGVVLDAMMAPGDDLAATLQAVLGPVCERLGDLPTLASLLVTDAPAVARGPLGRRFRDVVEEPAEPAERCGDEESETALGELFAAIAEAVPAVADEPCCLWCHAGSLGVAWDAPLAFRDSLGGEEDPEPPRSASIPSCVVAADEDPDRILGIRQAFAGQLMLADRMLGFLLEILDGLGGEPWTVVVAGLRGMPMGLHGDLGIPSAGSPPLLPYGDLVQMPVIIADARGRMAGQRYGGLLAAEDLGVFLAESLADHEASRPRSQLAELVSRWGCTPREQVISTTPRGVSLVTKHWRMVVERPAAGGDEGAGESRLFAKPDDFFEQCDVADRCSTVVDELQEQLTAAVGLENSRESSP